MKMKSILLIVFFAVFGLFSAMNIVAQNVGISDVIITPEPSSILELRAIDKGLLIPRVALTQTTSNAPVGASVVNSLLVYNTATVNDVTPGFYYWENGAWVRMGSGAVSTGDAWELLGNTATNPSVNFLGTTDAVDFVVRTDNTERMRVQADGKVGIGLLIPAGILTQNASLHITRNGGAALMLTRADGGVNQKSFQIQSYGTTLNFQAITDAGSHFSGTTMNRSGDLVIGYSLASSFPHNISFYINSSGQLTKSIGCTDNTSTWAGAHLRVVAGGPGSSSSNQTGGNLYLSSGASRGNVGSNMEFQTATAGASGSTLNTPTTKMIVLANGNVGINEMVPVFRLDVREKMGVARTGANPSNFLLFDAIDANSNAKIYFNDLGQLEILSASSSVYSSTGFGSVSTKMVIRASDNHVGIGVINPTHFLSLSGSENRTIWMERNASVAPMPLNGFNLTVQAGGAKSGESNMTGGDLLLNSGIATGSGSSNIYMQTATSGASGTADRNPTTKMTILGSGNVGIGTTTPSQLLHVNGNTRLNGHIFDVTNSSGVNNQVLTRTASGVQWMDAPSGGGGGWLLTGNAGTVDGTHFLGTTDNVPLNFRMNNIRAGRIDENNTFFGLNAGLSLTSGIENTLIGRGAGNNLTAGSENTAIGYHALFGYMSGDAGNRNIAVGKWAMFYSNNKNNNTVVGFSSLSLPAGGLIEETVVIGYYADQETSTVPTRSVAIGSRTKIGAENSTAIGYRAMATQANSMVLGSINGINSATANTDVAIGTIAPRARLHIANSGGFAIGDANAISTTDGQRRSIQIATDVSYGGVHDNHSGYLVYSIMPGGWGDAELHLCTSNNWGTYNTGTPALRITQTTTYANGIVLTSDKRLKTNVNILDYGLSEIMQIKPVSYTKHIAETNQGGHLTLGKGKHEIGFIAQDLYEVMPEVVEKPENEELWGINYTELIPVLVKGMQEQQELIQQLQAQNEALQSQMQNLQQQINQMNSK